MTSCPALPRRASARLTTSHVASKKLLRHPRISSRAHDLRSYTAPCTSTCRRARVVPAASLVKPAACIPRQHLCSCAAPPKVLARHDAPTRRRSAQRNSLAKALLTQSRLDGNTAMAKALLTCWNKKRASCTDRPNACQWRSASTRLVEKFES